MKISIIILNNKIFRQLTFQDSKFSATLWCYCCDVSIWCTWLGRFQRTRLPSSTKTNWIPTRSGVLSNYSQLSYRKWYLSNFSHFLYVYKYVSFWLSVWSYSKPVGNQGAVSHTDGKHSPSQECCCDNKCTHNSFSWTTELFFLWPVICKQFASSMYWTFFRRNWLEEKILWQMYLKTCWQKLSKTSKQGLK